MTDHAHITKSRRPLWRKAFRVTGKVLLVLFVLLVVALIFLGEITEWYVEKYDVERTGREIELRDVYINLITGVAVLDGLTFYEPDGTTEFISARGIIADINPWQLVRKRIVVEEAGIDRLSAEVSHTYREFNYDDLIQRFIIPADSNANESQEQKPFGWEWRVSNIHVDSCKFNYRNLVLESQITVLPFNLSIPVISSGLDTFSMHADLAFIKGGAVNLDVLTDPRSMRYDLELDMDMVPIDYLYLYLRDYLNVADFGGYISAAVKANGSIREPDDVVVEGEVSADQLRLLDTDQDTVLAIRKAVVEIDHVDNARDSFDFGSVLIDAPYLRFELYPEGDNFTQLIGFEVEESVDSTGISTVSLPGREYFNVFVYLADYLSTIVEKYKNSSYRVDSVGVFNGRIYFADHTMDQDAIFYLSDVSMTGQGLNTSSDRVEFDVGSDINEVGRFDAHWSFNPRDVLEMELEMKTTDFLVSFISPYAFYHTAYPFTYGDALYEGSMIIQNRKIESNNHLFVEDMEVGRKGFADPPIRLPIRLAVSILKDLDGNIDLEIPVKGDLEDPKFVLWPAIFKVLKNTLVKVATAPFRLFAGMFQVDEEDLKSIPWVYGQKVVEKEQIKRARSISKVLKGKPELALTYTPVDNIGKEVDYLAMFSMKELYYRDKVIEDLTRPLTSKDTFAIGAISPTDSLFYQYLKAAVPSTELISAHEMAREYIGADSLVADVKNRIAIRDSLFRHLLMQDSIQSDRIVMISPDSLASPPDTFNLIGPIFYLGFAEYEPAEGSSYATPPQDSTLRN